MSLPCRAIELELSENDKIRFWQYVDKAPGEDSCWGWLGAFIGNYGTFSIKTKSVYAHRIAFIIENGSIPDGHIVCHHCDNGGCVRPSHLFDGTYKRNTQDAVSKGRMAVGDRNGTFTHPETRKVGELNGRAKITESQVLDILHLFSTGEWTKAALARKYLVTETTIFNIIKGKLWKHLARR